MTQYKNQYVRDLAWILSSPPLLSLNYNNYFLPQEFFETEFQNFSNTLEDIDNDPRELNLHITNGNTHLLGKYFESLIEFWLRTNKDKKLLAHNLQVFKGRQTIGEFDFLYRDLLSNRIYHLECAGKFYIAQHNSAEHSNFIGPNAIDNLERKVKKTIEDQILLSRTEAGKDALLIEGIEDEVIPKVFLKGYLFYYSDHFFSNTFVTPIDSVKDHPKGWWIYAKDIDYFFKHKNSEWIIIERAKWISKIYDPNSDEILSGRDISEKLKKYFESNTYPLLIAQLEKNEDDVYEETNRGFVVSDYWPNTEF